MKKTEKILTVANLTEKLKLAKSIILADYRGLSVSQMGELRNLVKKAGGELTVVKNTLLKRAFENAKLPELKLEGPTAIVIAYEEEIAPLKAISDFAKSQGLPTFKSGIWEDRVLTREEIEKLGSLPGRQELIATLLYLLRSPSVKLVSALGANTRKLILVINAKSKIKNLERG